MERTRFASTSVVSAGYDAATRVLEIEFSSGRIYQFDGVPQGVFDWLVRTPSKGSYVSRMINDRYPYRDVTPSASSHAEVDLVQQLQDSLRRLEDKKR
jgi:hypothetical protein